MSTEPAPSAVPSSGETRAALTGPYWIWPLRVPAADRLRLDRWCAAGAVLTSGSRWIAAAAVAGVLPLLLAYAFGWSGHRLISAALLFPAYVSLVRGDRQRAGFATVLVCFALHSATAIALTFFDPAGAAGVLSGGEGYWEKNIHWIRTGLDPEYLVIHWLPAHARQLVGMSVYAFTSLGLIPLAQGLYEIDLMNFYVGRLLRISDHASIALFAGWHFWSILRGVAYTRIVFEVSSLSLSRLTGVQLSSAPRRRRRWLVGLTLLVLDGLGKYFALEPVRLLLSANLS